MAAVLPFLLLLGKCRLCFSASSILLGPGSDEIMSCPAPHHSSALLLVLFWSQKSSQRSPKIDFFSQGLALILCLWAISWRSGNIHSAGKDFPLFKTMKIHREGRSPKFLFLLVVLTNLAAESVFNFRFWCFKKLRNLIYRLGSFSHTSSLVFPGPPWCSQILLGVPRSSLAI